MAAAAAAAVSHRRNQNRALSETVTPRVKNESGCGVRRKKRREKRKWLKKICSEEV